MSPDQAKTHAADNLGERRVARDGRVTIPVSARRRWGLAPPDQVEVIDLGFAVILRRRMEEPSEDQ